MQRHNTQHAYNLLQNTINYYFKLVSTQPYFMAYCIESLRNLPPIENSIGDGEI